MLLSPLVLAYISSMVDSPGHAVAGIPLLETKLYSPKWRPGLVARPRLIERLQQGIERKLTLVSAPAGCGKTTLLAEWLATAPAGSRATGWVSLDPSDNDPALFWAYFITALQSVQSEVGARALSLLHAPQPPPMELVLTTLINEINAIEVDFALLLDDYHVIEAAPVHSAIGFLLDHLPPQMHLIIASRSDPPLPLARLRGRSESTELRAADLCFTSNEAAAFLNEVMGLELAANDVVALEKRTEGWIAGLQLAALSMQGRQDVPGFIAAFSGDDRYIVDYLVEEVLQRQPAQMRRFLLQTSVLERLSGSLCDAVAEQDESRELLEALERGNLFVVALDDKRQWYRYHHLFADVLQAHLLAEQPDRVPILHLRASIWYEQHGLAADAVRHALAAEDFERAAGLIELQARAMGLCNQEATWLGWVELLPDELVRVRPVLSVYSAFALLSGQLEAAETRLQDAERLLGITADMSEPAATPAVEMVVVDEEELRSLPGMIAIARAYRAGALGDVAGIVKYAQRALDLLPERDYKSRGSAAALLGLAYWMSGDLAAAHRSVGDGMVSMEMTGDISAAISVRYLLAEIRLAQGRLRQARSACQQALQLAAQHGEPVPQGTADIYVELGELYYQQGDIEAATQHLLKSKELGEHAALLEPRHRWYIAMARIKAAQGDLDGALDLLDEAERQYLGGPAPDVWPVAALKARVWIVQGRLAEALGWGRAQDLSVDDELSYLREFEHITLAKVLIAQYRSDRIERSIDEAMGLLERLLQAAQEGERKGSVIEILLLQALAHQAQSDISSALAPLQRALTLAEPEGYVRIFVDEGEPMRELLRHAMADGIATSYTQRLLSAFGELTVSTQAAADLVVPLTAREIEVLRLIAAGMRNQEIADQLFISPSTVKRHIANAYGKLGVGHRTEAVARANELNLL